MYDFALSRGVHATREEGMCVMEAVAYVAGEKHSDHPACACPVLSYFLRAWNDNIRDDWLRTELLMPFVPRLVGTKATPEIETQRHFMCYDWLRRECLPIYLNAVPSLAHHGAALAALPEQTSENWLQFLDLVLTVRKAVVVAAADADADVYTLAAYAVYTYDANAAEAYAEMCQDSAVRLVDRMIRLTERPSNVLC